jgi:Protein of unknown function (DUF1559)
MTLPALLIHGSLRLACGLVGLVVLTSASAPAQERIPAPLEEVRPPLSLDLQCVPPDAAMMVSLNVGKVWKSKSAHLLHTSDYFLHEVCKGLLSPLGLFVGDIERVTMVGSQKDLAGVLKTHKPLDQARIARHLAPRAHERSLHGKPYYINEEAWTGLVFLDDCTVLVGKVDEVEKLVGQAQARGPEEPLALGLDAVADGTDLVVAVRPSKPARSNEEASPGMDELMQARTMLITADFGAREMKAAACLKFPTARLARTVDRSLHTLYEQAREPLETMAQEYAAAQPQAHWGRLLTLALEKVVMAVPIGLKNLKTEQQDARLRVEMTIPAANSAVVLAMLGLENQFGMERSIRLPFASKDQLRKLGQAMLDHHRKTGRFPAAAIHGADGKPLLSWRVALLPYLGQGELYKKFHLDEPWDSDHNRKLVQSMPEVFQSGRGDDAPTTTCQVFVGKGTAFEGKKGKRLRDFKDGPEQTILIAQGARCVVWTKPEDLHYSADKPLPGLAFRDGWAIDSAESKQPEAMPGVMPGAMLPGTQALIVVLANGEVVRLPRANPTNVIGIDSERMQSMDRQLRALITRNGADKVEAQEILVRCSGHSQQVPPANGYPQPSGPLGVPLPSPGAGPYPNFPYPLLPTYPPPPYGAGPFPNMQVPPLPGVLLPPPDSVEINKPSVQNVDEPR